MKQKQEKKETLTKRITIRFTPDEEEKIRKKTEDSMITISQFIRKASLGRKIESKIELQTLVQLKRIGNNINQIARIVNAEKSSNKSLTGLNSNLDNLKKELDAIIKQLQK